MIDFKDRVKSPFEDDNFIKDLIIKYLQAGDIYKFYDLINEIGKENIVINKAEGYTSFLTYKTTPAWYA